MAKRAREGSASWRRILVLVMAGLVMGFWIYLTPRGLLGRADAIGYAVCHRIDVRSFHIGDRPLPMCARCTGMYLGSMLALAFVFIRHRGKAARYPSWPFLVVFGLLGLAYAVDGANSLMSLYRGIPHLYPPANSLRMITGTLFGVGLTMIVFPSFNQVAWNDGKQEAPIQSWQDMGILLLAAGLLILLVLSENAIILYPLALLSSLGVLALLGLVYTTVVLLFLKRENKAKRLRDLLFYLLAGLTIAVFQITLIDLARLLLTGTWQGFSF